MNPDIQIVVTVSPIRHTREGLVQNSLSKARLLVAAHQLTKIFPYVSYFPSYEIVVDELRDYRWFEEDLIHPNNQAQDLIFSRFGETFFSPATLSLIHRIEGVNRDIQHRPIISKSKAYRRHIEKTMQKIEALRADMSCLDFDEEITFCKKAMLEF